MSAQLCLDLMPRFTHGGHREGAGRKRIRDRGVAHRVREKLSGREPAHITLRAVAGLPSLRGEAPLGLIRAVFRVAGCRDEFRIVHYAVLSNHIHLIVEADGRNALSSGLNGLKVPVS